MNHDTTSAKRRPTLLSSGRNGTDESREPDCGPVSILSSIDAAPRGSRKRRPRTSAPRRPWAVAAAIIVAVSAAVAGLAYIDKHDSDAWVSAPVAPRAVAVTPPSTPDVAVGEAPVPAPTVAAAASEAQTIEAQSAVIETVVAVEAAPPADVEVAAATNASKPASPATTSSRQPDRASKPSKRAVSPTKRGDTKLAKAASAQKDPDVDLIEALVSHVAGKDAAAARVRVADAGTPKAGTRDVVLQQEPAVPTSELVRRCMTLGWLESQLCRARICSGQWGQDAACPTAQQQNAEFRR